MRSNALRVGLGTAIVGFMFAACAFVTYAGLDRAAASTTTNGDNGTVKVHKAETSEEDPRNEPHVCEFYVVGNNFDAGQDVWWQIKSWPPTGDRTVVGEGTLQMDENGHGRSEDMELDSGHYKLYWNFAGENGRAKQKVFWTECVTSPSETPSSEPSPSESETGAPTPSPVRTDHPVTG
ncbi:MAG: hypothetical protein GEV07_08790 [Streptosporangiales bacterium]|nr:hypothetical protein [Streptosporangiales bacterium]